MDLRQRVPTAVTAYVVALAATAGALLLRYWLDPLLASRRPYLTLFGAVAVAVWHGRWRAAVLAAVVGFLATNYFFVEPREDLTISLLLVDSAGYLLSAGLIILFGEAMHRPRDRAEHAAEERAASEASERQQKEELRVTFESIGDAVITTTPDARVTFLNGIAESLTGWTVSEALGQPLEVVFHIVNEQTRTPVENPAARAAREGITVGLANHTILIRRDGAERPIDDSAAPIRDAEGNIVGCILVFRDITSRRRAEQERADDSARIESIVNHVLDGIIAIDEHGTVQALNPAAERLFGYEAKEVIGRNVKLLMPEPFHSEHDGYLAHYRQTGEARIIGIGREVEGRRKDGVTFPMDLAVSEFVLGQRRYFTGIVRDITERKQAEKQRQEPAHRAGRSRPPEGRIPGHVGA